MLLFMPLVLITPGILANISNDGSVRSQRVLGISVFPVQYNPDTMILTVYENLHIEVSFKNGEINSDVTAQQDSDAYEKLFSESLLNYDAALDYPDRRLRAAIHPDDQPGRRADLHPAQSRLAHQGAGGRHL